MYIEAIIIGVIIGMARNGRLSNFLEVRFKGWYLCFFAFVLFLVPYGLKLTHIQFDTIQIFPYIAMAICALIAWMNFQKNGMKIILLGIVLNLIVMGFNDFLMPIDTIKMTALGFDSFVESLKNGNVINYIALEKAVPMSQYLGKVIALPDFYPLAKVLSIGDIIVSIGIVWVIQYDMLLASLKSKGSMLQFTYNTKMRR